MLDDKQDIGVLLIILFVKENPEFLKSLEFEDIKIGKEQFLSIKSALSENSWLEKLSFINCGIVDECIDYLAFGVQNSSITELNLSSNKLTETSIPKLVPGLQRVKELNLSHNQIGAFS